MTTPSRGATVSDSGVPDPVSQTWDLSTGLLKQAAADQLGVATKTLERRAAGWGIRSAPYRRPTGGAVLVVYHPGDVARAASVVTRSPVAGILVPDGEIPTNGNGHRPQQALIRTPDPDEVDAARLLANDALMREWFGLAIRGMSQTMSQTPAKLLLTIREAAEYSGLPRQDLRRLIKAGTLPAITTARHGYRIRRKDLETL